MDRTPRIVRNFFVKLHVDGKQCPVHTGPRQSNGGFDMVILMRDEGEAREAFFIRGYSLGSDLYLVVEDKNGNQLQKKTKRDAPNPKGMSPMERLVYEVKGK